jgi:hypothetical protein
LKERRSEYALRGEAVVGSAEQAQKALIVAAVKGEGALVLDLKAGS